MRTRRLEQTALTTLLLAACITFFIAAYAAVAHAQNAISTYTVPQSPETPVSPTTPGTLPGTTALDSGVGTNPITGAPCLGGGASAVNGGIPGAPTAADQPAEAGSGVNGLPSNTSVYGLSNELSTQNPGSC